ncbi:hypothetical protein [Caulobacter sp. UNC279MFTsu5.1]|uniref:hypothetical protein n=1 Tax=Caulobacter sp. UNC279MFTsu5.1 TaxID=1502775 RepID=UPI0008E39A0E|nr:hypothetical protein [Caulobacter sp. UNC279MFTsu5.1]SFJ07109.1 hypothetical protein SAMN02799626_01085 [Caulobacter sp. UNC279MFTsu5.1]
MKLPQNKTTLIAGVAAAAVVTTVALAMAAWPALTRPDPPAEAAGDDGLRISVVEPPKAPVPRASPLDVGLSEAAQAMAKSRAALFAATPAPAPVRSPRTNEDDGLAPLGPSDDRWERERAGSGFELARQMREEERAARRERDRREAQEQADRDRRWDEERERERADDRRYDDRYGPPPPPDDDRPPPEP